ncbi:uncharacterized protein LOC109862555 isoform X2 [Pseudomyrmex gracilis]|nr:uncharacterized protein LOC109862555 isoform X2 [Pseudomyrmex gracilis]
MEEFPGKKTNSRLYVFNGYMYNRDNRYEYIYRCNRRSYFKCKGSLQQDGEMYTLIKEHDHPPDTALSEKLKMKQEMKQMCKNRYTNSKDIFDTVSRRYPVAAASVSYNTMRSPLYREKIKYKPSLPSNFLDLHTKLQTYEPLSSIYKGKATSIKNETALIFSTDILLKELAASTEMYLDGTFSIVPKVPKIAQLFTIHIRYCQTAIATVFILCETRTKFLYDAIWIKIKQLIPDLEKNIKFIMLDYERAAGISVSENFPSAAIHGCWFHFNQAIFRKWKCLNLLHAPRDVLFMTMTLPLAPPKSFSEAYKIIEKQADTMEEYPDIYLFLAYLRRNWLQAASKVSVYKCPMRTNNIVESFHNIAAKKFGSKHSNLWLFLEKLSDILTDQELDLERAKSGLRVRRICSRLERQNNLRIVELQEDLVTDRISLEQFLKMFYNQHQDRHYSMQQLIHEDANNDDDVHLEHFSEIRNERENTVVDQTSSRQVNVSIYYRGRGRRRRRTNTFISPQRSVHVSPENNPERRHSSEEENIPPVTPPQRSVHVSLENNPERRHSSEEEDIPPVTPPQRSVHVSSENNPEGRHSSEEEDIPPVTPQRSVHVSPENNPEGRHSSEENVPPVTPQRSINVSPEVSQDIILLNSSDDEDIYHIPLDDYGNIFSDEDNENIDVPYHPVQQSNDTRTPDCCTICLVEKADHIFVSCGHLCCCGECILQLQSKKCPICNVNYTSYLKVRVP